MGSIERIRAQIHPELVLLTAPLLINGELDVVPNHLSFDFLSGAMGKASLRLTEHVQST
jgi:hypothetical protein